MHTGQRKTRTFAVKNVVTLSFVVDRRTDGCAKVRAVGVIKPATIFLVT